MPHRHHNNDLGKLHCTSRECSPAPKTTSYTHAHTDTNTHTHMLISSSHFPSSIALPCPGSLPLHLLLPSAQQELILASATSASFLDFPLLLLHISHETPALTACLCFHFRFSFLSLSVSPCSYSVSPSGRESFVIYCMNNVTRFHILNPGEALACRITTAFAKRLIWLTAKIYLQLR